MAVGLAAPGELLAVKGVRLAATAAGIKSDNKSDLLLIELCKDARVAGIFTRNVYCAAPVTIARQHLAECDCRALLINSGNANAGTGATGKHNALTLCTAVAESTGLAASQVLPFSTGVIGLQLPVALMQAAVPNLVQALSSDNWSEAATAIMTTDTLPKALSQTCIVDEKTVTITGMSKGSGMIHPDMATMLAFVATDAVVDPSALQNLLKTTADDTFNSITVDGDTSTNDACMLIASGMAENRPLDKNHPDWSVFSQAVADVMRYLAHAVIRDGEGATRFIEINVSGGKSRADCRLVAFTIAHSPLVKTAFFAGDPNLGRILAAIGRSGVAGLDMNNVSLALGDLPVVVNGEPSPDYQEATATNIMAQEDVQVHVGIGSGAASATVWTTDLSYDYIKINAEYRS